MEDDEHAGRAQLRVAHEGAVGEGGAETRQAKAVDHAAGGGERVGEPGVGAPSTLAIDLAEQFEVTLAGFVRPDGMNLYTHDERVTS